ncbi:HNH endonuclease signature motif containing protein [Corynebacterium pseudodiphtheriticum]|uniref:HNH endonuclease signature motif containing protein n=2 Tax=Corynebacterium pseudodiphtheriticum TaxID=37637 RepID=UPI00254BA432|nr:HNH endonuclease signature motif containing protein [Corynebacterium pseudodiphtheriticum]MDK8583700.1 HNH endonuclease signature motif containing protein [Corynebacterium pseudodiphtheriticum]MDK8686129.1 HNH endonuclease signature motif containing protein [Corynebacterium pseudodiphtheriticum]MDK8839630.1 HNH endonuclease signature motif containing protein [Corynebacterium pseudodiphtheriticum]
MAKNNHRRKSQQGVQHSSEFPEVYFTHCNPHDKDAMTMLELRRHAYFAWKRITDLASDDYDLMLRYITAASGVGSHKAGDIASAFYRMSDLPQLRELATSMWQLDLEHWITIDRALNKAGAVNASLFAAIDELLVDLLTPTKPNQQMASRRTIRNRITREIDALDSSVRKDKKKESPRKTYGVNDIPDFERNDTDTHEIRFDTDAATAVTIDAHIREHAKQAGLSLRDATIDLLLGKAHTSVTLNCYRANDIADAPLFISTDTGAGVTTLFGTAADNLADQACKHHDMDAAANHEVTGYATTPTMRAAVTGRDGHCRYPGCEEPATICQMDHVIEYNDGGPTTPANLISLCQHHHNIKTDKRTRPIFEPATATIVWLFADGTWQSTEAEGPLAKPNRRWVQTVAQKMSCYRNAQREEAQKIQRLAAENNQTDTPGMSNSPQTPKASRTSRTSRTSETMTEEQQLWYSDILKLQSMLNHDSFRTIKIAACRKHINKIQQAITAIRNLAPVAESRDRTDECAVTQPEVAGDPWVAAARQKSDDPPPF